MNLTKISKDLETSATGDKIKKLKLIKPADTSNNFAKKEVPRV